MRSLDVYDQTDVWVHVHADRHAVETDITIALQSNVVMVRVKRSTCSTFHHTTATSTSILAAVFQVNPGWPVPLGRDGTWSAYDP